MCASIPNLLIEFSIASTTTDDKSRDDSPAAQRHPLTVDFGCCENQLLAALSHAITRGCS